MWFWISDASSSPPSQKPSRSAGSNSARGDLYHTVKLKPRILNHVATGPRSSNEATVASKQRLARRSHYFVEALEEQHVRKGFDTP
jgi:hypothetical protein